MRRQFVVLSSLFVSLTTLSGATPAGQQPPSEPVRAIAAPATPLPSEADSRDVSRFAFLVYGDTRGRRDGIDLQYEHSLVIDSMLSRIKLLAATPYAVRFALQSGDAVVDGRSGRQWNTSFVPLIDRLTKAAGVPYFLAPGNHDVSSAATADAPERQAGLHNYLNAMAELLPSNGSARRLSGYPTYAVGYGNIFVLVLDSNIAGDAKQLEWTKQQLDGLDRARYVNVIALLHHPPFSSGPHGGAVLEQAALLLRTRYLPLFRTHHVRIVFAGHEHLFEHWVERYEDATGPHRLDHIVSGGGGAPLYAYTGEPDVRDYVRSNEANKVRLEHVVKPAADRGGNPHHYLVVRVDGDRLDVEVVGVDWGAAFQPYRSNTTGLQDRR